MRLIDFLEIIIAYVRKFSIFNTEEKFPFKLYLESGWSRP